MRQKFLVLEVDRRICVEQKTYPYTEADATLRSRFEMVLDHTPNAWTFTAVER